MQTAYIVQPFIRQSSGKKSSLIADTPISCATAHDAENRAERMSDKRAGVIAISQEYDPVTGDYGKLTILAQYGEIPPNIIADAE